MSAHTYNAIRIAFALAAFGVVGSMDMEDAIAAEQTPTVAALQCRDKLKLRLALTADEARGRCDQPEGTIK